MQLFLIFVIQIFLHSIDILISYFIYYILLNLFKFNNKKNKFKYFQNITNVVSNI